jgi:peptide deformylase
MSVKPIITGEKTEILRKQANKVKQIDKTVLTLIRDMRDTMFESNGVGIAAPQVNESLRIIICRFNAGNANEKVISMINPEIIFKSDKMTIDEEGCLSLPKVFAKIKRAKTVQVKFLNEKGKEMIIEVKDFNSRIVQHEVDHLDGVLFVDYLN